LQFFSRQKVAENSDHNIGPRLTGCDRQICVPVGGPNGIGKYFIRATCDPECRLTRADLEVLQTSKLEPEQFSGKLLSIVRDGPR
jgi:hypothetical protein